MKSKIKYIQSLSHKKHRDSDKVFIAEGPKIINELLSEPAFEAVQLFAVRSWIDSYTGNHLHSITEVDEQQLERISFLSTPNQVLGIFRMPDPAEFDPGNKISILLSNIQDPGNMGTIIRCADWFGIEQIVCSIDCVDAFNPKVVQATMGSIARVKVIYQPLEEIIRKHPTVQVLAATLNGKNVKEMQQVKEAMLLIGNESRGIPDELLQLPHEKITIAKKGQAESLNAALATAIILHSIAGWA